MELYIALGLLCECLSEKEVELLLDEVEKYLKSLNL